MLLSIKNKKSLILLPIILVFCLIFIDNLYFKQFVIAYKATKNNYAKGVTVTGSITAINQSNLTSLPVALITKVLVKEGAFIKKNQPLAMLDDKEALAIVKNAKAQLLESQATLKDFETGNRHQNITIAREKIKELNLKINTEKQNFERNNFEFQNQASRVLRLQKLYEAGAVSFREYERATYVQLKNQESIDVSKGKIEELKSQIIQAQENVSLLEEGFKVEKIQAQKALVEARKAQLEEAISNLEEYTIYAPKDGYIPDVLRKEGDVAGPDKPVFKFVTDKNLYFKALVEENNVDAVYKGQETLIILDAYPLKIFKGKVFRILKEVNPQSGTFIAHINLPKNHQDKFFTGMTGDITFVTRPKGSIIIPSSFVFDNDSVKYVFKKKNNKAIKTHVVANYFTDFAIIEKGLDEDDVVLKPIKKEELNNNQRIKIKRTIKSLRVIKNE